MGRKTGAAPAGFGGIAARAFRDQQDGRGASGLGRQLQPTAFRQSDGARKFGHHQPGAPDLSAVSALARAVSWLPARVRSSRPGSQ